MSDILSLIIQEKDRKKKEQKFTQLTLVIDRPELSHNTKQEEEVKSSTIIIDIL